MDEIKEYIEDEFELEVIEYTNKDILYFVTPMFIIFKSEEEGKHYISFGIDHDASVCIGMFADIQDYFTDYCVFYLYEDNVSKVDEHGNLTYFCFGLDARKMYYNEIHDNIELQKSIPKDATFH